MLPIHLPLQLHIAQPNACNLKRHPITAEKEEKAAPRRDEKGREKNHSASMQFIVQSEVPLQLFVPCLHNRSSHEVESARDRQRRHAKAALAEPLSSEKHGRVEANRTSGLISSIHRVKRGTKIKRWCRSPLRRRGAPCGGWSACHSRRSSSCGGK